jgi:VanZ family protein
LNKHYVPAQYWGNDSKLMKTVNDTAGKVINLSGRRRLLLPLAYMAGLLLLSSVPGDQTEGPMGQLFQWVEPQWQNLLHVPLYAGLAASWLWALASHPMQRVTRLCIALLVTLLWAALDETYQIGVPGRYSSLTDMALNALGACLAVGYAALRPR